MAVLLRLNTEQGILRLQHKRVWTCRVHDRPRDLEYDERGEPETWDWPVWGCTCDTSARWEDTDDLELRLETFFDALLKEAYLPAIIETLNQPSMLLGHLDDAA